MKTLFVNEVRVDFCEITKTINTEKYTHIFQQKLTNIHRLEGKLLFVNPTIEFVQEIKIALLKNKFKDLERITFLVSNSKDFFNQFISDFKLIEAAGGIVRKKDKILLIKRLGFWDFPKGKIEKGENKQVAAIREVEEECTVQAELDNLITKTYHVYPIKNSKKYTHALKKTYWYRMNCLDDFDMKPQKEEAIEQVGWMNKRDARIALSNSYQSLKYLYKKYFK